MLGRYIIYALLFLLTHVISGIPVHISSGLAAGKNINKTLIFITLIQ